MIIVGKPLKILFLSYKFYPNIGGIEMVSEILASSFTKAGHTVHLITTSAGGSDKQVEYVIIRRPTVLRLIKEHLWSDVIFENNPSLQLSWPSLFLKKPLIIAIHTWIERVNGEIKWQDKLKMIWLKRANSVIACSNYVRKRSWPNSIVIENPYDDSIFKNINTPRTNSFVFLGRLVSTKGADIAVRAFHLVSQIKGESIINTCTLTIIGDGPEKKQLQKLVHSLDLNGKVIFAGSVSGAKLVALLNQHKFMLVPSKWEEPFGVVALEGMACGCIPIVSNSGGLPDAIGKAGLIFKRGDMYSLAECMSKILLDKNLEEAMRSEAALQLAAHTSKEVSRKYLAVIEKSLYL